MLPGLLKEEGGLPKSAWHLESVALRVLLRACWGDRWSSFSFAAWTQITCPTSQLSPMPTLPMIHMILMFHHLIIPGKDEFVAILQRREGRI